MRLITVLSIAAAGALLAGCAAHEPRSMAPAARAALDCDGNSQRCDISVWVDCPGVTGNCTSPVSHDMTVLHYKAHGVNKITWLLQTSGYRFASNGIEIDPAAFTCRSEGPQRFSCTSRRADFGTYKYTVRVEGPRPVDPFDPWVVNRN